MCVPDSFQLNSLTENTESFRASHSLAIASELAYEPESSVEQWCRTWGFSKTRFFDQNNTQGFVTWNEDILVLAYRGTEKNLADWIRNLRISSTRHEWGRVHRGFNKGLSVAWEPVKQAFEDAHHNQKQHIWITGHSLGGALATLAAAALQPTVNITGIHTFGQPRTANSRFGSRFDREFDNKFFRYVNDRDIVTRIPPGYSHFGTLRKFDKNGDLELQSNQESLGEQLEEPALTTEQFAALQGDMEERVEGFIPGADDHSLANYIKLLSRILENH